MPTAKECRVFRVPMANPGDTSAIEALIDDGRIVAADIVAIFGKTEGNGCVNDFTRPYAVEALKSALAPRLGIGSGDVPGRVHLVMSGGTEGALSPHFLVFAVQQTAAPPTLAGVKRLAIGAAATPDFAAEEIGRLPQIYATAEAVGRAMAEAGIASAADVHFVQIKCPLITAQRHAAAVAHGARPAAHDTYASMALSRGASALGVGLALGEIDAGELSDETVCRDYRLWSGQASASAGIELLHSEVIVLGNSAKWAGDLVVGHAVMQDALDLAAAETALRMVGIDAGRQLTAAQRRRVAAVMVKAEASADGRVRGKRHTMLDDSDIHATRHARAFVGGAVAALIGFTDIFVSGGAEHQGPDGGGPVAVIATAT
ncbi:MAG TPA: ring-opening amidohydrolase [Stellaceae bacterium]|nr:ring-opening amidohydrolase [Stellaceae bacterium]